jgi:metallo-beta-lactamase class B
MVLEDGGSLTLGGTTLHFEHTPGHTPGTTSLRFSVFDDGQEHLAYFHGGSALRTDEPEAIQRFIDDLERIQTIPGIEVQIINHSHIVASGADDLFTRAERLKNRQAGEPHPWVAPDEFQRWLSELIADSYVKLEQAQ